MIHLPQENYILKEMPGGEWHIQKNENWLEQRRELGLQEIPDKGQLILARGGTPDDLICLQIFADAVRRDGGRPYAIIPYLPGARQDRRQEGEALSAKVYADIINSCGFNKVVCIDPHSDVMPALINNLEIAKVEDIFKTGREFGALPKYDGIIAPDAGAAKRAFNIAQIFGVPVFQALKHRDMTTGYLSHFSCETLPAEGEFLIVDDICDGGGTFRGLSEYVQNGARQLDLWVTHGIFSNGAENLKNHFRKIFTTNSHPGKIDAFYDDAFRKKVFRTGILNLCYEKIHNQFWYGLKLKEEDVYAS